jgi:hypothetical protein
MASAAIVSTSLAGIVSLFCSTVHRPMGTACGRRGQFHFRSKKRYFQVARPPRRENWDGPPWPIAR